MKRQLAEVERLIYDAETRYLGSTLEHGNVLTGWGPVMEATG